MPIRTEQTTTITQPKIEQRKNSHKVQTKKKKQLAQTRKRPRPRGGHGGLTRVGRGRCIAAAAAVGQLSVVVGACAADQLVGRVRRTVQIS